MNGVFNWTRRLWDGAGNAHWHVTGVVLTSFQRRFFMKLQIGVNFDVDV